MKTRFLVLSFAALGAMSAHGQQPAAPAGSQAKTPSRLVSVVAIGSIPKSVVKWGSGGEYEYVMTQPNALPPAGLNVPLGHDSEKKFAPFPLTLNAPTQPVGCAATGLVLYKTDGPANADPAKAAYAPALTIPTLAEPAYQLVLMWRPNPKGDWSQPQYLQLDLADAKFAPGEVRFLNLIDQPVRVALPQTRQVQALAPKGVFAVKPDVKAPTFNYRVDAQAKDGKVEQVVFTGVRMDATRRMVVVVHADNDGKPVSASFVVPNAPPVENKAGEAAKPQP